MYQKVEGIANLDLGAIQSAMTSTSADVLRVEEVAKEIKALTKLVREQGEAIDTDKLKAREKKFKKQLKEVEQFGRLIKDLTHQQELLGQLTKPKRPDKKPSSNYSADEVDGLLVTCDKLKAVRKELKQAEARFEGYEIDNIQVDANNLAVKIDEVSLVLEEAQEQYSSISVKKRENEVLTTQKEQL